MLYHVFEMLQDQMSSLRVFTFVNFRIFLAILSAMLISFVLGPWIVNKLRQLQIGQNIREEGPQSHQKKAGTPTMGGLLILTAIIIPTLLWANLSNPYVWILVGSTFCFGMIGFLDDFLKLKRGKSKGLGGRQKLSLQIGVSLVIAFILFSFAHPMEGGSGEWGDFTTELTIPFTKQMDVTVTETDGEEEVSRNTYFLEIGWLFIPFVIIVMVGASNAVNLTDGLDGLAIGASGIVGGTYTVMAYLAGNTAIATYLLIPFVRGADEAAIFGGAIIGASLGFLWWNCFPADMFMGDVGSLALGGAIGTMAVVIKQELLLVIVGFLFVMEAVSVILQVSFFKLTGGKRLFRMAPIHHHFELKGWSEPKVITRFLILAVIFAMIGLSSLKIR
jgi:phospho-N-acetylmuramoyl-pentapeptide-transferase